MVFWLKSYKRGVNRPFIFWNVPLHISSPSFLCLSSCLLQTKQVSEGKGSSRVWLGTDSSLGGLVSYAAGYELCDLGGKLLHYIKLLSGRLSVNSGLMENLPVTSRCASSWSGFAPFPPTFRVWMQAHSKLQPHPADACPWLLLVS